MECCTHAGHMFVFGIMFLVGSITGCAHLNTHSDDTTQSNVTSGTVNLIPEKMRTSDDPDSILQYALYMRSMPFDTLRKEYGSIVSALARDNKAPNRIRMALLLSMPGVPFQDSLKARYHLEKVIENKQSNYKNLRNLARILVVFLDDRTRIEGEMLKMRQEKKELQHKLDQLKVIERDTGKRLPPKPIKE